MSKDVRKLINKIKKYNQPLNENKDIDCSSFFNIDSVYEYVEFDKPLYSMISKRKTARLIYMKPKQYIFNIARNFGGLSYDDTVKYGGNVDKGNIDKYAEAMRNGDKFPVPYYNTNNSFQEGRHRALAAMKNGCTSIPVIEFSEISNEDVLKWANEFKDKTYEELNDLFIDMGFKNGITYLGYNDLIRYIQYN